jgi:hypothetical protein
MKRLVAVTVLQFATTSLLLAACGPSTSVTAGAPTTAQPPARTPRAAAPEPRAAPTTTVAPASTSTAAAPSTSAAAASAPSPETTPPEVAAVDPACGGVEIDLDEIARKHACSSKAPVAAAPTSAPMFDLAVDGPFRGGQSVTVRGTLRNPADEPLVVDLVIPDAHRPNAGIMALTLRLGPADVRQRPPAPPDCAVLGAEEDAVAGALSGRRVRIVLAPRGRASMKQILELTGYSGVKRGGCPVSAALRPGSYALSAEVLLAGRARLAQQTTVRVTP